jgi:hypothetical protein
MGLEELTALIDALAASDLSVNADAESIREITRLQGQLEAVAAGVAARFDTGEQWALDGAANAAVWMATECHMAKHEARRLLRRGRGARHLRGFGEAWASGAISGAYVDKVSSVRNPVTADALARDEEMLLEQAKTLSFEVFARVMDYWQQHADPDGTDTDAEARRNRRDVYLSRSFDGMFLGRMTLDPLSGAVVAGELERLEHEMFEKEWAEARAVLGREPKLRELERTQAQRRADSLVEMATRSGTAPAGGKRPAPLFSVLVGYETVHGRMCELADGTVLSPGSLLPWLEPSYIERAVFGLPHRVEVSASARLFTGATRRAIEIRDRGCVHRFCDRPVSRCEIDHIIPYAHGGPTTQENGRCLCGFHNRLRNQRPPPGD